MTITVTKMRTMIRKPPAVAVTDVAISSSLVKGRFLTSKEASHIHVNTNNTTHMLYYYCAIVREKVHDQMHPAIGMLVVKIPSHCMTRHGSKSVAR